MGPDREDPAAIKRHMLDDPEWLDALAASLNGAEDDAPVDPKRRFKFNLELFDELLRGCRPGWRRSTRSWTGSWTGPSAR